MLRLFGLMSVFCLVSLFLGCGVVTGPQQETYPVVVFSDIHFNPFDDPSLCPKLDAADITAWPDILQGSKISTKPAPWTKDTNYPLLTLALSGIKQNMGSSPLLIFTGDLLGHNFPGNYHADCGSSDPAAMQAFSIKTANFVMQQVRAYLGNVPVMFVVGNSDSYLGLGPDSSFLAGTVQSYYTNFLMGSTSGYSDFYNTFASGGYYSTVPMPGLKVIGLNTNPFTPPYPGFPSQDTAVYSELTWLDTTLASAQSAGQKVWLLMHIPPGADTYTSATNFASGPLTATTAAMMWKPDYQQEFLRILAKYPGVVTMTLAAHTHRDEFRIMSPGNALDITPSISPFFSNNPAFKVFTLAGGTFTPVDYRSLNYDLATMPAQFNPYYTFSQAYSLTNTVPLDTNFAQLYPQFVTNGVQRSTYIDHFNSGNNTVSATPITPGNWPVFFCGISNMAQSDFIRCVNGY